MSKTEFLITFLHNYYSGQDVAMTALFMAHSDVLLTLNSHDTYLVFYLLPDFIEHYPHTHNFFVNVCHVDVEAMRTFYNGLPYYLDPTASQKIIYPNHDAFMHTKTMPSVVLPEHTMQIVKAYMVFIVFMSCAFSILCAFYK